jgi:hypothetical protein
MPRLVRGEQTFIAGLMHDNLFAPWVITGAMDGEAFEAYVQNVLAPELQPGTAVIPIGVNADSG